MARLVPRRATRIVLLDAAEGLAERAASVLGEAGYSALHILAGGIAAWEAAGFELFSGVNVPSKAFGEFVEHESHTPSISAEELDALMRAGTDMVVLLAPVRRILARFDTNRRECARRGARAARARHRAQTRDAGGGQLRGPHALDHRRAVADQCGCAQQSRRAAQRHDGLEPRGASRPTAASRRARRRSRMAPSPGRKRRPKTLPPGSVSARSTRQRSPISAPTRAAQLTSSTCAIRPNTPPAMWRARFTRRAGNSCRRPTSMPERCTRASCAWTTEKCAPP